MIRLLLALAAAGAFANLAQAAEAADVAATCPPSPVRLTDEFFRESAKTARDHGFLWRIAKDGHDSYLYGTIHAARPEWLVPGPTVGEALHASDTMALEIDALDPQFPKRFAAAIAAMRHDPLPPVLEKRLEQVMAEDCIDPTGFVPLTAEFKLVALGLAMARREGLFAEYAIDVLLSKIGHGNGKEVVSLETPQAQLQAIQMPTAAETLTSLETGLAALQSGEERTLLAHLANAWRDGDFSDLSRYPEWCRCATNEAERAALKRTLDDRNSGMAASIDALHASGKRVFAAVGSLHMVGPLGLPELMRQRGYEVSEIVFQR